MASEIWKIIPGYDGDYQISDLGRVCSLKYGKVRILKLSLNRPHGYLQINLIKQGRRKCYKVHRLVGEAFIGSLPKGKETCHGPEGKLDNSVTNLSYGTHSENCQDKIRDGTAHGRHVVRSDGVKFKNMAEAALESGTLRSDICQVCKGRKNTAGGFGWSYIKEGE